MIDVRLFLFAFSIKLVCSWSYYWLSLYYNIGGDANEFLANGSYLSNLFSTNPSAFFQILTGTGNYDELFPYYEQMPQWFNYDLFYNDNHTLIRINALLNFITGGFYSVNAVWFAFFSMTGSTALFKLFEKADSSKSTLIFFALFFIPSTFFWTAGISKEAWLTFSLGIFLYSLNCFYENKFSWKYLLVTLISGYLLIYIKIYFLLALLPALISFYVADKFRNKNPFLIYSAVYMAGIILLFLFPGFDFINYVSQKQHDFISYTQFMQSGSYITIPVMENNWLSFVKNSPYALWNVLARPYLWEAKSFFWLFPSIENIIILLMLLAGVMGFKFNTERALMGYACLFYAVSIFVLIGLTTPVIGGLLRYKAPLLPFLLIFFIFHFDLNKLKSVIRHQP